MTRKCSIDRPVALGAHPLLNTPIGRSLWRLAAPTTALIVVQIVANIAEIWIVGQLGTEPLAGYVLVIPFAGLMANMANGGMGGSVASALARALGGNRLDDARAILLHAFLVALGFALLFGVLAWTVLPHVFVLMAAAAAPCTRPSSTAAGGSPARR